MRVGRWGGESMEVGQHMRELKSNLIMLTEHEWQCQLIVERVPWT
jgi:hypothetical protein